MKGEEWYSKLPVFLQNVACTYYGWREKRVRMGSAFQKYFRYLLSTETADGMEVEAYQNAKIAEMVDHAYDNVPYYRNIMDDAGLKPEDITSREALSKLPVLRKSDVIYYSNQLRSNAFPKSSVRLSRTSGTTGTALEFYTTDEAIAFQWAVWWRHRNRFGFFPNEWHVNFTGKPVVPIGQKQPPYWRLDYARKQIVVPGAHLTRDKIHHLVEYLNRRDVKYFTGYPSQIGQFCSLIESEGLELIAKPKTVFPGAESVQEFQRDAIHAVTNAFITDQYGFSEGAANASKCEYGNYHEDWEFGVLECVGGHANTDGSITGKIVATGFSNKAFPFLRYDVGDTATWAPPGYKCPCGRHSQVIKEICGRSEDYVITPEGNRVMRFDYLFKETSGIREAQVIQRELGTIVVRYVPSENFEKGELDLIRSIANEWISPRLQVLFEEVDAIPRSATGKFRPVISELKK